MRIVVRTVDWGLTRQLLEHLGGTGQSVTRLADGDVENELLNAELAHGVGGLVLAALGLDILAIGLLGGVLAAGLHRDGVSILSLLRCHPDAIIFGSMRHGGGEYACRLTIVLVRSHVLAVAVKWVQVLREETEMKSSDLPPKEMEWSWRVRMS